MNKVNKKIRIAVQNKGRLMEASLNYLSQCGLQFKTNGRKLIRKCKNTDIEILFVRNCDIPEYVQYAVADYGIVGQNTLMEKTPRFDIIKKLGFGKCKLVIAAPKESKIKNLSSLEHERIATSYPKTLKEALKKEKISASIIEIKGAVEICPLLGLADAVFDITQTGNTLRENGLRVVEKIAESQAVLIKKADNNLNYEKIFI